MRFEIIKLVQGKKEVEKCNNGDRLWFRVNLLVCQEGYSIKEASSASGCGKSDHFSVTLEK